MDNYLDKGLENKLASGIEFNNEFIIKRKLNEKKFKKNFNINYDDMEFLKNTVSFEMEVRKILMSIYWADQKYKEGNFLNAAINGFFSNIKARKTKNHSSLIYILSKNPK